MGYFAGIENAVPGGGGVYFKEGRYRVEVKEVKAHAGVNGVSFIVETTILESTVPTRPAGMSVSWVVGMQHKSTLGNIKQFAWACAGDKTASVGEADIEFMVSKDNPLRGQQLDLECLDVLKKSKDPDDLFTKHTWAPTAGWPAGQ